MVKRWTKTIYEFSRDIKQCSAKQTKKLTFNEYFISNGPISTRPYDKRDDFRFSHNTFYTTWWSLYFIRYARVLMTTSQSIFRKKLFVRRVWRYQRGNCVNQNPYIEEVETTQWQKEKVQKDKQRSTKHTHLNKPRRLFTIDCHRRGYIMTTATNDLR
jgi:hypothetical protein